MRYYVISSSFHVRGDTFIEMKHRIAAGPFDQIGHAEDVACSIEHSARIEKQPIIVNVGVSDD